jgi:hypothetical protein
MERDVSNAQFMFLASAVYVSPDVPEPIGVGLGLLFLVCALFFLSKES